MYHGDLAARNVMLAENSSETELPVAKIADFGLAKRFYESKTYILEVSEEAL